MDTYITLMMWIGHLMRMPLTKLENVALTIIRILRMLLLSCYLLHDCYYWYVRRIHSDFVRLLFLQAHRETDRFFCSFRSWAYGTWPWPLPLSPFSSQLKSSVFSSQLKSKCGNILAKTGACRIWRWSPLSLLGCVGIFRTSSVGQHRLDTHQILRLFCLDEPLL
jgi:hypothetical protein